jgi:hypothetical protein
LLGKNESSLKLTFSFFLFSSQGYCQERGLGTPDYHLHTPGFHQWHCEVVVDKKRFPTTREYRSEEEAQSRAAHIALRDLILSEITDENQYILSAESQFLPEVKPKDIFGQLRGRRLSAGHSSSDDRGRYSNPNSPIRGESRRSKGKRFPKKGRNHDRPPPAKRTKPTPSSSSTMAIYRPIPAKGEDRSYLALSEFQFTANDPTVKGTRSNRVPVENCRLSDIKVEEKVTDRLETLKALQEKLKQLPGNASFYDLMAGMLQTPNCLTAFPCPVLFPPPLLLFFFWPIP